jgi:hypothetical protein
LADKKRNDTSPTDEEKLITITILKIVLKLGLKQKNKMTLLII